MSENGAPRKEAIVFDLDGTLIEVSGSYKKAIVETASYYLPDVPTDIIEKEMTALKSKPNFNNDWDATYYIIKKLSGLTPKVERDEFWNQLRDIFQSYYLGEGLFIEAYNKPPPLKRKVGLIATETPLISESTLQYLNDKYLLAVATSRPRFEALYALSKGFLDGYFSKERIVTLDDVSNEKPDPEPLLKIKSLLKADKYYYIGDTLDDVTAAKAAGYTSIIIGNEWGDVYVPTINDLVNVL